MGEVYRATRHEAESRRRDQGPAAAFAADPERLARFEREAQLLAPLNHPNIAAIYGLEGVGRRPRAGDGARRGRGSRGADRARADAARRGAADRAADRRGARSGARAGHRPPRSEAAEHQGARRRHGQGARLRPRQGAGSRDAASRRRRRDESPTFTDVRGDAARRDPRHRRLHGAGAGARQGGRQARRHLGLRRRALRDADRAARCSPARRSPTTLGRGAARTSSTGALPPDTPRPLRGLLRRCLGEGPEAAAARHRRRAARRSTTRRRRRAYRAPATAADRRRRATRAGAMARSRRGDRGVVAAAAALVAWPRCAARDAAAVAHLSIALAAASR